MHGAVSDGHNTNDMLRVKEAPAAQQQRPQYRPTSVYPPPPVVRTSFVYELESTSGGEDDMDDTDLNTSMVCQSRQHSLDQQHPQKVMRGGSAGHYNNSEMVVESCRSCSAAAAEKNNIMSASAANSNNTFSTKHNYNTYSSRNAYQYNDDDSIDSNFSSVRF
jgi:hypothetical protein